MLQLVKEKLIWTLGLDLDEFGSLKIFCAEFVKIFSEFVVKFFWIQKLHHVVELFEVVLQGCSGK